MKFNILPVLVGCLISGFVYTSEASTCHARAVEAVELKAIDDGEVEKKRLYLYETSVNRAGFNLYVVTLKLGEKKLKYDVFSDYNEQFLDSESLDCNITAVYVNSR